MTTKVKDRDLVTAAKQAVRLARAKKKTKKKKKKRWSY